ncbi:hypothetical protein CRU99_00180 [Malaciobacter mytili]|uniref:hypothetical protein n=1 Tax=Malaciobacter mytili TaxID=603050 RepID=UPI00100B766B|nr:hypothetical protein [Malaciobacter mytili]RXI48825.1 hypothetical protein CRU99_00180 [Malaciobacter mytili]
MKNNIKIGFVVIIGLFLFTGCFSKTPEDVVESHLEGYINTDFEKFYNPLSANLKENFSKQLFVGCVLNKKIKKEVIPKLKDEDIDIEIMTDVFKFQTLEEKEQNKVIAICFETISKNEKEKSTFKILSSNVKTNIAIVKYEMKNENSKKSQKMMVRLEKMNDEWKIIEKVKN